MDSAIPSLSAGNLDHLAFLAFGLRQINPNRNSRQAHSDHNSDKEREAKLFDALAHLAICRQSDQVVAIGAAIGATGAVEISVSENGEVDKKVTTHLQFIVDALFRIRESIRSARTDSSPSTVNSPHLIMTDTFGFIASTDVRPIAASIRQLELDVLDYSRPKVFQRIKKNKQYKIFADGMGVLLDTLPSSESECLTYLSAPENIRILERLDTYIRKLAEVYIVLYRSCPHSPRRHFPETPMGPMATTSDGVQGLNQKRVLAISSTSNSFLNSTAVKLKTLLAETDLTEVLATSAQHTRMLNERK